jgi:hypothetical protein
MLASKVGGSEDRQHRQGGTGFREQHMVAYSTAHHADRIQAAIASNGAARSALIASWRRSSSLYGLDPAERKPPDRLTDTELCRVRQEIEPLIQVAQSSLDRLFLAVGGAGCCVLLADRNGIPVERRGAPGDDATFLSWGLWPGTSWSEESEGTNGIGTCRGRIFSHGQPRARILVFPVADKGAPVLIAVDADRRNGGRDLGDPVVSQCGEPLLTATLRLKEK